MAEPSKWTMTSFIWIALGVLALLASPIIATNMYENLDAAHVMVIQAPVSGELSVFTDQGVKPQYFGEVTKYPRRSTFSFQPTESDLAKDPKSVINCKQVQFNDGGHAHICGSVQWEMPLKPDDIIANHKAFRSAEGIQFSAVSKMIDAALYFAGPSMSSIESVAERRSDLVQYVSDQAEHGVYVTRVVTKEIVDPITGTKREVAAAEIVHDAKGMPQRQQGSILQEFSIKLLPLTISKITYDDIVAGQIAERQKATNQVQIAQANARRAEQEKLTTEAQGAANAAKAKWEQETIKAKVVTEAQQRLEIARLDAQAAEQYKRQQILIGEGDAQRKQLVMAADGALDQKLKAYVEVNAIYAEAVKAAQPGAWSPVVSMGGAGASGASNASAAIDLFVARAAKDLGVDLSVPGRAATAKKPSP